MTQIRGFFGSSAYKNTTHKWMGKFRGFLVALFMAIVVAGVCYIILAPLMGVVSRAFMSRSDLGNPLVFLIPLEGTMYNISNAFRFMNYTETLVRTLIISVGLAVISVIVCSFVGYGFARFRFPGMGVLFALVIISIVIPVQMYMMPMVMNFTFFMGNPNWNMISPEYPWPIIMLTATGVGIRSGLYIFIFRQFFRGIPKEIEEAAFVDGASPLGTYFRIMLPNAVPAIVTVFLFALVWNYNDTTHFNFLMTGNSLMSSMLLSVGQMYTDFHDMRSPLMMQMISFGGVVLAITPILLIYAFLQRFFVEGLERSGIVG